MKVVLSWLREFCPTELPADELAEALTAVGVKVEELIRPWQGLEGVVVAEVLEVTDHPNSDKLCVARVRTPSGESTVCAGVRNFAVGDLVPYAAPGSRVPVLPEPLGVRTLRGVESHGMLCSPRELNVADVHTGIMILGQEAPFGADVKAHFGLDDAVLDIEIEPNRPDLMSVVGVAREAAAVTGTPVMIPEIQLEEDSEAAADVAAVEIEDLERCPNYLARVIRGARIGPSPTVVQARLSAAGMRPISNVVDATNYVLLERGHPLHPFDLSLVEGATIVVRRAGAGESLTTLDDIERELTDEDLLIADRAKGVAIAGVMGSAAAEVSDETSDVLLEAAYFQPRGILRTSRRLGLSTEASSRFERGTDPEGVRAAADRAAELIAAWSGGRVLAGVAEGGGVPPRRMVQVRPSRVARVLGEEVASPEIARRLSSVGFAVTASGDTIEAEVPGYRIDVEREIDLIEEVVRVERGYERVAATTPAVHGSGGLPAPYAFRQRIRELLVRQGLCETWSMSFASAEDLQLMGDPEDLAVRVANPLQAEESFLRTRLTPGLLRALQRNRARNVRSVGLFEVGTVFRRAEPVQEFAKVGFALTGQAGGGWADAPRDVDFFDGKGILERLLEGLGVGAWSLGDAAPLPFHPGRSAAIELGGAHAGLLGELHPRVADRFDLPSRTVVGILSVSRLMETATEGVAFRDIPRFPPVRRDLAFVVPESVGAGPVLAALTDAGGDEVGEVVLFDVFSGGSLPEGAKSLAFAVELRSPERTLTDEEADAVVTRIAERLAADFGAELRAG